MLTQIHSSRLTGAIALVLLAGGCAALDHDTVAIHDSPAGTLVANTPTNAPSAPADDKPQAAATKAPTARTLSPNATRVSFSEEGSDFDPCVSRDGEKIVFASTQHRHSADLYLKRLNSRAVTQLTTGGSDNVMPAISPDGQRVAFASNRNGNWDIFLMPIGGGQPVQITSDNADELHASWSPDGKQLVFCRLGEASGRWEMWVTDAQNPATSTFIGYGLFPQWCPVAGTGEGGSDKILFQLSRDRGKRTFGIWTIDYANATGRNLTEIAAEPDKALINPAWSPDGRWVCFAEIAAQHLADDDAPKSREARLPANAGLWMIGADGTGRVNLASGGASLMPTWGPDNSVYFVSNRGGYENIWSVNAGTGILSATGQPPASAHAPAPHDKPVAEVEQPKEHQEH